MNARPAFKCKTASVFKQKIVTRKSAASVFKQKHCSELKFVTENLVDGAFIKAGKNVDRKSFFSRVKSETSLVVIQAITPMIQPIPQ